MSSLGLLGIFALGIVMGCSSDTSTSNTSPDAVDEAGVETGGGGETSVPNGAPTEGGVKCATDSDCAPLLASVSASPAGCAEAFCDKASVACQLRAVDKDGDGYRTAKCEVPGFGGFAKGNDCDDDDKDLFPGKSRACSATASGTPIKWTGGTPQGECKYGSETCGPGGLLSVCNGAIAPAALPTCTSDLDSTCVGKKDSDICGCKLGLTKACYTGKLGTSAVGTCKDGVSTCIANPADATTTLWDACVGEVVPATADTCAVKGADETCNGIPNEKCSCVAGDTQKCGTCLDGTQTCTPAGAYGVCVGARTDIGTACGSCGGLVTCGGGCSVSTPPGYGLGCGSCGGTVQCAAACSVATPASYGSACGSCGGTIKCDGACSVGTPAVYGSACGCPGGYWNCASVCSKPLPPDYGVVSDVYAPSELFSCCFMNYTKSFGGACSAGHQFKDCYVEKISGAGSCDVVSKGNGSSCTCLVNFHNNGLDGANCKVHIQEQRVCN